MNYLLGLDKVWARLDGYKSYLVGCASILTGMSGILTEIVKLINDKSLSEAYGWFKNLPQDQGWLLVLGGAGIIGLRHSNSKIENKLGPS